MLPLLAVDERWTRGSAARATAVVVVALALATVAAAMFEGVVGVADASPVYLVAVVLVAGLYGTWAAVATSVLALLTYDFGFTTPRLTFTVSDPTEWLSLVLFLFVAVVTGRLTALLRERAETADRRAREGQSLVAISRAIAMATSFEEAAAEVARRLCADAEMETVAISLGQDTATQQVVATAEAAEGDVAGDGEDAAEPWTLMRSEVDGSSDWVRIVPPAGSAHAASADSGSAPTGPSTETRPAAATPASADAGAPGVREAYLVPIEADRVRLGSILATRPPDAPRPGRGARRILSLAADQLGIALKRDELRAELTQAEVARQSDALRAAILDSVSHDLRTPIATIRALAGGLVDPALEPGPTERRSAASAIDAEAERLAGLVRNLLDMGRIQAGAVRPDLDAYELGELIDTATRGLEPRTAGRAIEVAVPDDLPPVLVDAVLFDVAATNVLDNAVTHAPPPAAIRISAAPADDGEAVLLAVDDGGPGVPPDALPRLFDRFYRVPTDAEPARHGQGMGLAIARGFLEAMGATIEADRSDLGGLRVRIRLPLAPPGGRDEGRFP